MGFVNSILQHEKSFLVFWKFTFKIFFNIFFPGIIIIAPIGITLYVVIWLFNLVNGTSSEYFVWLSRNG